MINAKGRTHNSLIIGHYGGCNTGDEAMLAGLLRALHSGLRSQAAVVVKNKSVSDQFLNSGITVCPANTFSVVRGLLKSDNLILGGGTHFHDDYTTMRYVRHFAYMLRLASLSILAKMLRQKVIWLGMGFGPFYRSTTRWVTRMGLKYCDFVTVRDSASLEEVAGWIPSDKLEVTFDLAALLADGVSGRIRKARNNEQRCKTLGISVTQVRKCLTCGPKVDALIWARLASALNRIIDRNPELRLKVIVLRGGHREDDQAVSAEVHRIVERSHPGRCDLVPYNPEPLITLRRISECDAFIATRFHAGVLAYVAGCRLLFLEYHRKVRDLAREIGLDDEACISLSEDVNEDSLAGKLGSLIEGHNTFRATLPVREAFDRALLNIAAVESLLTNSAPEHMDIEPVTAVSACRTTTAKEVPAPEQSHTRFSFPD